MTDVKLGRNLKKARQSSGLTQREVADKVGINTNFYARLERGEEKPSLDTLKTIAKILKIKVSELVPY